MSTWLITGCSTGLGRALAETVIGAGHNAVVTARDAARVADLADADRLASGSVPLNVRRTDLESLVNRVVDETTADGDHDFRVVRSWSTLSLVDQLRTEQILVGLLRTSADRTQSGKTIVVRLQHVAGGAMLSVEDTEPSSDASISPLVRKLVEIQGGTVKAESRDGGGSAFRVFLPDGGATPTGAGDPAAEAPVADVQIVVNEPEATPAAEEDDEPWEAEAAHKTLAAELRRLAELQTDDR